MDLSALLSPLLTFVTNVAQAAKSHNLTSNSSGASRSGGASSSSSPLLNATTLAALDRTLGTMATVGLTLALYQSCAQVMRHLTDTTAEALGETHDNNNNNNNNTNEKKESKGTNSPTMERVRQVVKVIVRRLLMGAGVKRIASASAQEYGAGNGSGSGNGASSSELVTLQGSCHCNAISFLVKAPRHVQARDNQGKIQYPTFISNAQHFQLTRGTRYLSIYYVNPPTTEADGLLPTTPPRSTTTTSTTRNSTTAPPAAHTFCKKCGVHILRVPDPHSNALEINSNCLDSHNGRFITNTTNSSTSTAMVVHDNSTQKRRAIQYEFKDGAIEVTPATATLPPRPPPSTSSTIQSTSSWTIDTATLPNTSHRRWEDDTPGMTTSTNYPNDHTFNTSHSNGPPSIVTKMLGLTSGSSKHTATTETPSSFASSNSGIDPLDSALSDSESSSCGGLSFDEVEVYDVVPPKHSNTHLHPQQQQQQQQHHHHRTNPPPPTSVEASWTNSSSSRPSSSNRPKSTRSYFRGPVASTDMGTSGSGISEQEPYISPLAMRDQLKYYMTKHLKSSTK